MGNVILQIAFPVPDREKTSKSLHERKELLWLWTEDDNVIPALHIRRPKAMAAKGFDRTILYSHGNAEDMGMILRLLDELSRMCCADVFAYEYPGYGLSSGLPSEQSCYAAIKAAYEHLTHKLQVDPSRIIIMGRSIGSGPTVELVSTHSEIRAMVLMSPFTSALGTRGDLATKYGSYLDFFKNIEKCPAIHCPVLIMHGCKDWLVPVENGKALHAACSHAVEPLWLPEVGHNDMPMLTCFPRTKAFLDQLEGLEMTGGRFRQIHRDYKVGSRDVKGTISRMLSV